MTHSFPTRRSSDLSKSESCVSARRKRATTGGNMTMLAPRVQLPSIVESQAIATDWTATATVLLVNHIANRTRIGEPGVEENEVHIGRSMNAGDLASRPTFACVLDRKSVVLGKMLSERLERGGC